MGSDLSFLLMFDIRFVTGDLGVVICHVRSVLNSIRPVLSVRVFKNCAPSVDNDIYLLDLLLPGRCERSTSP